MRRKVVSWPLKKIAEKKDRISFPGFQREPHLWTKEAKRLLIDSVLRDIDIPKLYFAVNDSDGFDVVDGQQRLWAIWDFMSDSFAIDLGKSAGLKKYSELPAKLKDKIDSYELQIVEITDANLDYLQELFLRLQLGQLLITGEKLNAESGEMRDFIFRSLSRKRFIQTVGIPKRRFARQTFCAQLCINLFSQERLGEFARTRHEDLQQFFRDFKSPIGPDREQFKRTTSHATDLVEDLDGAFGKRAEDLKNRSYLLSICLLFDVMRSQDSSSSEDFDELFVKFTFAVWSELQREKRRGINRANEELFHFENMLSSAPGEKYQIARRHSALVEFFKYYTRTGEVLGSAR